MAQVLFSDYLTYLLQRSEHVKCGGLYSFQRYIYIMLYKCKLFFLTGGRMLALRVKNNFLFSQHDACMYFSPNSPSKSTHGQWQHPITSPLWGNGSCSFHLCLFTSKTAFSWTSLTRKVTPLFHHHLWFTPMLTPHRPHSLQPRLPLLTYSIRAPSGLSRSQMAWPFPGA